MRTARSVNLYKAKVSLSRLVDLAAEGQEIVIAKAGVPKAKLVPFARPVPKRKPGAWKGKIRISANFDAALPPEVLSLFEGGGDTDQTGTH